MEATHDRRLLNLHTFDELKKSGNELIGFSNDGRLIMKYGITYTIYTKKEEFWMPVKAYTIKDKIK